MESLIFKTKISAQFYLIKSALFLAIIASVFLVITNLSVGATSIALFSSLFFLLKTKIIKIYNDRFIIEELHWPKRFSKREPFYFNEIKAVNLKLSETSKILVVVFHDDRTIENTISASEKDLTKATALINAGIARK